MPIDLLIALQINTKFKSVDTRQASILRAVCDPMRGNLGQSPEFGTLDEIPGMKQRAAGRLAAIDHSGLANRIAQILTEAIITGEFEPGARLTEAQLARDLGVSRAPVREAARLLENRGLVIAQPRRGFFVRTIDAEEIDQIYDLRICLERHAGALLIARLTEPMLAALADQVALLHRLAEDGDATRQVEEDLGFHRMICSYAGNRRLLRVYDELTRELRFGVAMIGQLYDDPHEIARTHDPVLAALAARDIEDYVRAIEYHIGVARERVGEMIRARETMPG